MEEVDAGKSTIKIDGKTRIINIVDKVMKLAPEQLEEVKEAEEVLEEKMIDTSQSAFKESTIAEATKPA